MAVSIWLIPQNKLRAPNGDHDHTWQLTPSRGIKGAEAARGNLGSLFTRLAEIMIAAIDPFTAGRTTRAINWDHLTGTVGNETR